ncbi:MAG: hypothetical protein JRN08_07705, partial [Nitrososphaerota archaeon]|nr:hypothetical protein [Nitrososphaerota archaeon]
VRRLIWECPNVLVVSETFTRGLRTLQRKGTIQLMKADAAVKNGRLDHAFARSDMVIVATSDPEVNGKIAQRARRRGLLVNAADNPAACDFYFPASAAAGDVRIAVSTGGRSPAMARLLCRRLSKQMSKVDQRNVRLQGSVREFASRTLHDSASRRRALYAVLRDGTVQDLLRRRRFGEAEAAAREIVVKESGKNARR